MTNIKPASIYAFLFLILSQSIALCAQQQVHGLVLDGATRQPMPFVNIAVVGSTYGTVSNQNGEFTLNPVKLDPADSIAFHYLGYETVMMKINDLKDGMTVIIKEKPVSLRSISIIANPLSPEELIRKALERKAENYPSVAQKREVFHRSNRASYINAFELSLKKSDIAEVDAQLIKEMVDSIPRYSRSYEDYLYTLFTIPADSAKTKNKVEGIKNVVLKEDDGGGLERVEKILNDLFVKKKDNKTFWKYKTGPLSFKESHVHISGLEDDTTAGSNGKKDPLYVKNLFKLYFLEGDLGWNWDFIQKTNRYHYQNKGIIGIGGEDAYAISFKGKAGADFQGMIYISVESFAILRIEYSLRESKSAKGFDMLGIKYNEEKDDGLILFEKDKLGYFPKYSMRNTATRYGVDRPFEIIRKEKRPVLNKKINEVALTMNLQGLQESCYENLVVYREGSNEEKFRGIQEKGVKPERITSYSDTIWKGYLIIEPTRQMKEYKTKIRN
jgi:hypothetical protein